MRKFELDNVKVKAPHASHIGFDRPAVKRGDMFTTTGGHIARSLGRIVWCDSDGEDCRGWICALVLGGSGAHAYVRWINPKDICQVIECPTAFGKWFFAKRLPPSDMVLKLADYGTLSEQFIGNAKNHIKAWKAGVSPAAYRAGVTSRQADKIDGYDRDDLGESPDY